MLTYTARHAACGTPVSDELPDGYPVDEGVGLYCPTCGVGFWHVEDGAPEPETADSGVAPEPPGRPAAPARRRRGPSAWPALGLIGATAVAAVLVVALVSRSGDGDAQPPRVAASPTPAVAAAPAAAASSRPAPAPSAAPASTTITRRLGSARVTLPQPRGWHVARRRSRLVLTGGRHARIVVSVAPRRGRSTRRLGRDMRAGLGAGRRVALRRVHLGGRPAVRVRGRGREVTGLVLASHRYVIARDVGGRRAARVAHGIRIRR